MLLGDLLANDILYDVDLLILASKCDLPGAVTEVDVADAMQVIFSYIECMVTEYSSYFIFSNIIL